MAGDDGENLRRGLGRELRAALEFDDAYAKTDEMKKRAIHTARDYDEFRNMVACATLTPVSSKELASLRQGKRGWNHAAAARRGGAGSREGPARQRRGKAKAALRRGVPEQAPRTGMEFLRDWRRCCATPEQKRAYLSVVGPSTFELTWTHTFSHRSSPRCTGRRQRRTARPQCRSKRGCWPFRGRDAST